MSCGCFEETFYHLLVTVLFREKIYCGIKSKIEQQQDEKFIFRSQIGRID